MSKEMVMGSLAQRNVMWIEVAICCIVAIDIYNCHFCLGNSWIVLVNCF